jgi:uroporphyrinogen-III synthase
VASRPLERRRIVVTRPEAQAKELATALERVGATAIVLPLVSVVPFSDSTVLREALGELERYEWVVFTSANGVAAVRDQLPNGASLASVRVAAVGPVTAAAIRDLGSEPAFVPDRFEADAIADGLGPLGGTRILLPQADIAPSRLADKLRTRGAIVDAVAAYRTRFLEPSPDQIAELETGADAVVLASGSAARSFASLVAHHEVLRWALLVCIGPKTTAAAREVGLPVGLVAPEATADGIIQALVSHYRESTA